MRLAFSWTALALAGCLFIASPWGGGGRVAAEPIPTPTPTTSAIILPPVPNIPLARSPHFRQAIVVALSAGMTFRNVSAPVQLTSTTFDLFAQGSDDRMYQIKQRTDGSWAAATLVPDPPNTAPVRLTAGISCTSWSGRIDCFSAINRVLIQRTWTTTGGWTGWTPRWSNVEGTPSCVSGITGWIDCFWRGYSDNTLWRASLRTAISWTAPVRIPGSAFGTMGSSPNCVVDPVRALVMCVAINMGGRLMRSELVYNTNPPVSAYWQSFSSTIYKDDPTVVFIGPDTFRVYGRDSSNQLHTVTRVLGTWQPERLECMTLASPLRVALRAPGTFLHGFTVSATGQLEYRVVLAENTGNTQACPSVVVAPVLYIDGQAVGGIAVGGTSTTTTGTAQPTLNVGGVGQVMTAGLVNTLGTMVTATLTLNVLRTHVFTPVSMATATTETVACATGVQGFGAAVCLT